MLSRHPASSVPNGTTAEFIGPSAEALGYFHDVPPGRRPVLVTPPCGDKGVERLNLDGFIRPDLIATMVAVQVYIVPGTEALT